MGASLAWLARREGGLKWLRAWRRRLALGASLVLLGFLWRDGRLDDHALLFRVFGFSALGLLCTLVLSLLLEPEMKGLRGRLGRALRWVGQRSYAIYVFHLPVLVLLFTRAWPRGLEAQVILQHSLLSAITLAITLLLASLSWSLFEKPILRLKARFEYEAPAS
jgi:peptidoglycan/LPS O-acetylase OafA/YrhL